MSIGQKSMQLQNYKNACCYICEDCIYLYIAKSAHKIMSLRRIIAQNCIKFEADFYGELQRKWKHKMK